jgi:hypothetical protein
MSFADSTVHRYKAVWGSKVIILALVVATALSVSCGDVVQQGRGNSFLIINRLEAAPGNDPTAFGGNLLSDVVTIVDDRPTIFNDVGRASFTLGLKDPGTSTTPNAPTQFDFITIDRYRVSFTRADGRNTPGVDVPYGFDGALTLTVRDGESSVGFEIVRHIMKQEAPLGALANNATTIATIAEVTFYGRDLAGREVSVSGRMLINFGNFADPQ